MRTNKKGFGLSGLILSIIFIALFVLLLIWLFRNYSPNMKPFYNNVFRENISYMQGAAKSYFTNDQLPTEEGQTVRLTLKQMEEMKLLIPFVDKDGKSCDVNKSYAEVTKEALGYTLKVNLVCGKESDYIIDILGCHDYCNSCTVAPQGKTAIEYEFERTISKDITELSCPKGYNRNGNICTKKTGSETISATAHYTKPSTQVSDVLYTTGASQTIEVATVKKVSTTTEKQYADVTVTTTTNKQYTDKISTTTKQYTDKISTTTKQYTDKVSTTTKQYTDKISTTTKQYTDKVLTTTKQYTDKVSTTTKQYTDKISTTTKQYTDKISTTAKQYTDKVSTTTKKYVDKITTTTTTKKYTDVTTKVTQECHDERIKDPNCKVECKWEVGSDGIPREVCNTCGYITHRVCTDVTTYVCPNGYISEGSGSSTKCYRNVTTTTYSCPSGYTKEGSGSTLKCYKNVTTYSCPSGYTKEGSGSTLKCYKNVTTYSCPSGYTKEGSGSTLKCYKNVTTYSCPSGYTKEGSGSTLKCYKNVTTTTYSCGAGLIKEGSGANTKCYKNVTVETTTYSCPSDSTSNNGKTGAALRCYKTIKGEKVPYCKNPNAKIQNGKCVLTIPSEFSHYSCPSGYNLNSKNGTCSKDIIDTVKATSTTKESKTTETKWSRSKVLEGWTATGRTRTVKVN